MVYVGGFDQLLERYPRRCQPLDEPEFLGGAGGLSGSRLWRYRSADGLLVVRAWPAHGPGREQLERIHHWLSLTAALGFIPTPIPDRGGRTLQEHNGRFWELAPWLAGAPESSRPPAPGRVRSAFAALAAFHQRLSRERWEGASTGLALRYKAVSQLVRGGLDVLEQAIERAGEQVETERREAAMRWVRLARAVAPRLRDPLHQAAMRIVSLQPCLRDARAEHFLFMGECVTGLIDFGAMDVDCVASDLARLMSEWFDGEPAARAEALAAYERVRPLDTAEAALIEPFASAAFLLIGEHWIRWHYLEGRRFDDPQAISQGIARGLGYIEQLAVNGERGLAK